MNSFVSDKSLREIGRIVVASAELDATLASILNHLVASRRAAILVGGQPFSWLDQAIREVVAQVWSDDQSTLIGLLGRARALHSQRDLVVHGLWLPVDVEKYLADEDPAEYRTVRARRWSSTYKGEVLTDERLTALADELFLLEATLRKWRDEYLPYSEEHHARDGWKAAPPS